MNRKVFKLLTTAGLLACVSITTIAGAPDMLCSSSAGLCAESQASQLTSMSQLELEACRLVNTIRQENGLSPLTISADLSISCRIKSQDMKNNRYFSHTSPTYGTPFQMMKALGISYRSAGENIASGYTTAQAVVNGWMGSEAHRANLLSARYHSMGIGYVDGYWTQWLIG